MSFNCNNCVQICNPCKSICNSFGQQNQSFNSCCNPSFGQQNQSFNSCCQQPWDLCNQQLGPCFGQQQSFGQCNQCDEFCNCRRRKNCNKDKCNKDKCYTENCNCGKKNCRCSEKSECSDRSEKSDYSKSERSECSRSDRSDRSERSRRSSRRCHKCFKSDCECVQCFPSIRTKCGCISATLIKSANPTFYTAVGQVITYSYTITNNGSVPICFPIHICDDRLGGQIIPGSFIGPGASQVFNRTYTIVAADLLVKSITNTASAFIQVKCKKWLCTQPSSATITFGSSDLSGTLSQEIIDEGTARVTVTISNAASSLTPAFGVQLVLPFPLNSGPVTNPVGFFPASAPVINASNVTISEVSIPAGATYTYTFDYAPTVIPGSYQWQGTITSASFETDTTNNQVSSTLTFP